MRKHMIHSKAMAKVALAVTLAGALTLSGCATSSVSSSTIGDAHSVAEGEQSSGQGDAQTLDESTLAINMDAMDMEFSKRDVDSTYDASAATRIVLSETLAEVEGAGAQAEGSSVVVNTAGTYVVSGALTDGQLVVEAGDQDKVQLVFDNVSIHNSTGPAVYVKQADKVFITLADQSNNVLSDGASYVLEEGSDEPCATVFSKDGLTINGTGNLTVTAAYRHGIASKDDLVITDGTFVVDAVEDGLRGRDALKIADGAFTVKVGEDAFKSNNDEDGTRGFTVIDGGTFAVEAGDDAFHAESVLVINDGAINVATCAEGLEAEQVYVNGGDITLAASDDGVNASARDTLKEIGLVTTDGMHGDVQASQGELSNVGKGAPEDAPTLPDGAQGEASEPPNGAPEGAPEPPNGAQGEVPEGAPTDAPEPPTGARDGSFGNAPEPPADMSEPPRGSSGQDQQQVPQGSREGKGGPGRGVLPGAYAGCLIQINGGTLAVDAGGDALDSNGYLEVKGGIVCASGSVDGGNSSLDHELGATIDGGTIMATGSSGMVENFTGGTQPFVCVNAAGDAQTTVALIDEAGTVVVQAVAAKAFGNVIASSPSMVNGTTYKVVVNGAEVATVAASLANSR